MAIWLIEQDALAELQASASVLVPETFSLSDRSIMEISGSVANIVIEGILTPKPDRWASFFGGASTAYIDIISAIGEANSDERVTEIRAMVGSTPGGNVEGMIPAMDAIRKSRKPITAYISDAALSAGYALVSQAKGGIYAKHRATIFGGVGALVKALVIPEIVTIANTDSPKKAPDLSTEEGKAIVREQLDKQQAIIVQTIADGRGVKATEVVEKFGRGASFPAGDALKAGMIDGIGIPESTASTGKNGGKSMDLNELKSAHPELVEAIKTEAVTGERARVSAHLVLGEASGDMSRSIADVKKGVAVTQETTAAHTAVAIKAVKKQDRVDDNTDLGGTPPPPPEKTAEEIEDEKICAAMTWAEEGEEVNANG